MTKHKPTSKQEKPKSDFVDYPKSRATLTEAANARIRKHESYWQQIDAEKERYSHDWNSDNEAFFKQFRKDSE